MKYAWIITKDHLFEPGESLIENEAGTTGPRDAPDDLMRRVIDGEGKTFRMWDDDGELYYTGRLLTTEEQWGEEDIMVAPLRDFGTPNAGAVLIKWHGHPEWTCEY